MCLWGGLMVDGIEAELDKARISQTMGTVSKCSRLVSDSGTYLATSRTPSLRAMPTHAVLLPPRRDLSRMMLW